mmetsp:Transcript_18423/g.26491  ORF Transcript_18423/g.26491 Transcript_18423/m.26491 type:complete len:89 (-) Transcript_18423:346-612(-)
MSPNPSQSLLVSCLAGDTPDAVLDDVGSKPSSRKTIHGGIEDAVIGVDAHNINVSYFRFVKDVLECAVNETRIVFLGDELPIAPQFWY